MPQRDQLFRDGKRTAQPTGRLKRSLCWLRAAPWQDVPSLVPAQEELPSLEGSRQDDRVAESHLEEENAGRLWLWLIAARGAVIEDEGCWQAARENFRAPRLRDRRWGCRGAPSPLPTPPVNVEQNDRRSRVRRLTGAVPRQLVRRHEHNTESVKTEHYCRRTRVKNWCLRPAN